jgi:hypothetical protein
VVRGKRKGILPLTQACQNGIDKIYNFHQGVIKIEKDLV